MLYLLRGVSSYKLVLGRLGRSIVVNINIFRTRLDKRPCSTKVELNGAKVNFQEAFLFIHMKIFKASIIICVQKVSKLSGSFELHNSVLFGFLKKGAQLVILLLKMVKTGILFDMSALSSSTRFCSSLAMFVALATTSAQPLQPSLTSQIPVLSCILVSSILVAYLDVAMNFDID